MLCCAVLCYATSDQHLEPFVVVDESGPVGRVLDGDAVVLFNFRADRVIQLSKALEGGPEFGAFDRVRVPRDLRFVGLMQYDGDLQLPEHYLVQPPAITPPPSLSHHHHTHLIPPPPSLLHIPFTPPSAGAAARHHAHLG